MAIISTVQPASRGLNQLNGNNNGNNSLVEFAVNQAERWIAAEPVTFTDGTAVSVTLRAKQKCWVDLSRLIVQAYPTAQVGAALEANVFNQDLNSASYIEQITFKGDQKMVQGTPASGSSVVDAPMGFFSPCRDITGWHLMSSGQWFELNTQDTIVISCFQNSGVAGKLLAAAPIVLDCDLGVSAYPAGIQPPGPNSYTGTQVVASTKSSDTAIASAINLTMQLNQAGTLNWNAMVIGGSYNEDAAATSSGGTTRLPYTTSYVTSIKDFSNYEYIQGVPDTAGNNLGLPLAVYMPAGLYADRAGFPWCRLQALTGTSGNTATVSVISSDYAGGSGGSKRRLSVASPFFGSPQDPLACR